MVRIWISDKSWRDEFRSFDDKVEVDLIDDIIEDNTYPVVRKGVSY